MGEDVIVKKISTRFMGLERPHPVAFPEMCVYCGAPPDKKKRMTVGDDDEGYATYDVPYCAAHARRSRRNTLMLYGGGLGILLVTCCVMFGITTSIDREPSTTLLVFLALGAVFVAGAGITVLRRMLARSDPTMAHMISRTHLGLGAKLVGSNRIQFWFANDQVADEFARLNEGEEISCLSVVARTDG